MDQTTINQPNNDARPIAPNNDSRLAQSGKNGTSDPIELTVTAHGPVDQVVDRFNEAMKDGAVSADERQELQNQIAELDAGERKELYRDIIQSEGNGASAAAQRQDSNDRPASQLAEFFKVLDKPVEGGSFGPKSTLPAGLSKAFADTITQHATVEQRTQFIEAAASDVSDNANLARAVGQSMISLNGNAEAMYEAMGSLFDADSKNAPLKAVMTASTRAVDVHFGVGAEHISHDQLNELIKTAGQTLQEGRDNGTLSEKWSRVYSGALVEAGSSVINDVVEQPFGGAPEPQVDATLGALTEVVVQGGAELVNSLESGSFDSWNVLETLFSTAIKSDNARVPGAIVGALRAPLDQLAGEIQSAHDNGNTEKVQSLHDSLDENTALSAMEDAGTALNQAIGRAIDDAGVSQDAAQNLWTGMARSSSVLAAAQIGGPAGVAFGVAAYVGYAAGGQAIDDHFNDKVSDLNDQQAAFEYMTTPANTGKAPIDRINGEPVYPKVAWDTDVDSDEAQSALEELKDRANAALQ